MLFDTPQQGYCLHALNAVFLKTIRKWIRIDARGNKKGVNAQVSTDEEQLAFKPERKWNEIDDPVIYLHPQTIAVLEKNIDAFDMYTNHLPDQL
ncbi:MAG TPA: hypothetical protein VF095_10095 [Bacillota bacterium]